MKEFITHTKNKIIKIGVIFYIVLLCTIYITGCITQSKPDYTQIPLIDSGAPYQLPIGDYTDTRGNIHHETSHRWSISEAELFQNSSEIKPQ